MQFVTQKEIGLLNHNAHMRMIMEIPEGAAHKPFGITDILIHDHKRGNFLLTVLKFHKFKICDRTDEVKGLYYRFNFLTSSETVDHLFEKCKEGSCNCKNYNEAEIYLLRDDYEQVRHHIALFEYVEIDKNKCTILFFNKEATNP